MLDFDLVNFRKAEGSELVRATLNPVPVILYQPAKANRLFEKKKRVLSPRPLYISIKNYMGDGVYSRKTLVHEVYKHDDDVELKLQGKSAGRRRASFLHKRSEPAD